MNAEPIRPEAIGAVAHAAIMKNRTFQVTGSTSHGVYLQPADYAMIFLSTESFRGPLTINIPGDTGSLPTLHPGDKLTKTKIDNVEIALPDGKTIDVQSSSVWNPPKPPVYKKLSRYHRKRLFKQVKSILGERPHLSLLEFSAFGSDASLKEIPELANQVKPLATSVRTGMLDNILSGLLLNLGSGPGLTPLGDDLIAGVLLTLSRSGKYASSNASIRDHARMCLALLDRAKEKTTTLSRDLLSCACHGSADERIIRVVDLLGASRKIPNQDLENLLDWGSSSGLAVLAGMLMVLSS
jgi:hypothetical protein